MYTSRNYKNIDIEAFAQDVSSHFPNITRAATLEEIKNLLTKYDTIVSELMDKHAPMKTRLVKMRPKAPWVNQEMLAEKRILRSLERRWRRSKNVNDRTRYKEFKKNYNRSLGEAHAAYLSKWYQKMLMIQNRCSD